jgi:hypothetical protein
MVARLIAMVGKDAARHLIKKSVKGMKFIGRGAKLIGLIFFLSDWYHGGFAYARDELEWPLGPRGAYQMPRVTGREVPLEMMYKYGTPPF